MLIVANDDNVGYDDNVGGGGGIDDSHKKRNNNNKIPQYINNCIHYNASITEPITSHAKITITNSIYSFRQ